MPASTPGPMTDTSRSAQISELIERDDTMTSSAAGRISVALGVVFRAARNATGTAGTSAASVPSVAMLSVSHSGRQSRAARAALPVPDARDLAHGHHCTRRRIRPDPYSAVITIAMIVIKIAAAVAYS